MLYQRGVAFNGVNFDPPAPTQNILGAHTLAPMDDAGGHVNAGAGYHYHAATGKSKKIKVPPELLMFLWILRYCIHDAESLHNLKTFLSPDTFTTSETMIECPLLTVDFFSKYLLSSVESIVHDIIGNKQEFLCQKIREHYVSKHDRRLFPKIQEFVYYSTASEFIKIMLELIAEALTKMIFA